MRKTIRYPLRLPAGRPGLVLASRGLANQIQPIKPMKSLIHPPFQGLAGKLSLSLIVRTVLWLAAAVPTPRTSTGDFIVR